MDRAVSVIDAAGNVRTAGVLAGGHTAPVSHVEPIVGVAIFVTVLAIYAVLWLWIKQSLSESGPGDGSDDEGGTHRKNPRPPGPLPDPNSNWWPDFERGFAAHVAEHTRRGSDARIAGAASGVSR